MTLATATVVDASLHVASNHVHTWFAAGVHGPLYSMRNAAQSTLLHGVSLTLVAASTASSHFFVCLTLCCIPGNVENPIIISHAALLENQADATSIVHAAWCQTPFVNLSQQ